MELESSSSSSSSSSGGDTRGEADATGDNDQVGLVVEETKEKRSLGLLRQGATNIVKAGEEQVESEIFRVRPLVQSSPAPRQSIQVSSPASQRRAGLQSLCGGQAGGNDRSRDPLIFREDPPLA